MLLNIKSGIGDALGKTAARRVLSACLTLAAVAVFAAAAVLIAPRASVPASAALQSGVVAISYRIRDGKDLRMLADDIDFIRGLGLPFLLPKEGGGGVMLIIESCPDLGALLSLIRAKGARAAVVQNSVRETDDIRLLGAASGEGLIEPAIGFGGMENQVALLRTLSRAQLEYALRYGARCACFVQTGIGRLSLDPTENGLPDTALTVFTYGSGVNRPEEAPKTGVRLLSRIVRLPDWTIADYFGDIAALG